MRQALAEHGATRQTAIAWADEFRIGLVGTVRRVWAPRGVKRRQRVQQTHAWYDLLVAVDGRHGRLWWTWGADVTAATLQEVLTDWRATGVEVVVWDHAPGHRAKSLQAVDLPRVRLVAYAPELNPAERIGEVIRAHTEGIVYPTLWAKMAAVEQVLTTLAADPAAVRQLCGWEWICRECEQLPSGLN